jgi:predicted ATPase
MQQKIVFIGGPGTGKSSVLKYLKRQGFNCMPEISREVTKKAQEEGIEQLFLTDPILFSYKLLEGREQQYIDAGKSKDRIVFFDRGIPSIHAYMRYFNTEFPEIFMEKSKECRYTKVFQFLPWKEIYKSDNERYETFEQSETISKFLNEAYAELGYEIINVPFDTVRNRCNFILSHM